MIVLLYVLDGFVLNTCVCLQVHEFRVSLQQANRVVVSVLFTNLTAYHLKDLEFNVLDSLNTKLMRGVCILIEIALLTTHTCTIDTTKIVSIK